MITKRLFSNSFEDIIKFRLDFLSQLSTSPLLKPTPIKILYNSHTIEGISHKTTSLEIAKKLNLSSALAAKILYTSSHDSESKPAENNPLIHNYYDLHRPIESDCKIEFVYFGDTYGKQLFRHSTAHVLGYAMETLFKGLLANGPALEDGYYYDMDTKGASITPQHLKDLTVLMHQIIGMNYPFKRFVLTKSQALQLFAYNPFKIHFINQKIPENGLATVYKIGNFVDLCAGPHVQSTGIIKAINLVSNSSAYWLGNKENINLQRVYGISFPSSAELEEELKRMKDAFLKSHKKIGSDLFFWDSFAAGSAFFLPEGTRIYNRLIEFIKNEYAVRGFTEVVTPNLYNVDLWKRSGHYAKYKEDMFLLKSGDEELGLKPMNCPGHCIIFDHALRSYRELPLRLAEFGVLHRNELAGALSGLFRVRRFVQDDSHIFCRKDQIKAEVLGCLDFIDYIYKVFDFTYTLELSTRPKNSLGSEELWKMAEAQLVEALEENNKKYKVCEGEGAFYGPKIDVKVKDAIGREHQCGTIQMDFNLPKRFNLQFRTENTEEKTKEELIQYEDFLEAEVKQGFERPVIIHRAILGSIERMIGVLTEQYDGRWPFWLSPKQVLLLPIRKRHDAYAIYLQKQLTLAGYHVEIDRSNASLSKKVMAAQLAQYNYMAIVGDEEEKEQVVDLRKREKSQSIGKYTLKQLIDFFHTLKPEKSKAREEYEKPYVSEINKID